MTDGSGFFSAVGCIIVVIVIVVVLVGASVALGLTFGTGAL